jgi:hypothetical protein
VLCVSEVETALLQNQVALGRVEADHPQLCTYNNSKVQAPTPL